MRIEARQMFRSNGLIDDLVVYGSPADYSLFADFVGKAISLGRPTLMTSESNIVVQIIRDDSQRKLFTSLQNETDEYFSLDDWNHRSILRVIGSESDLAVLQGFLKNVSGRGRGYSYISEYSGGGGYSMNSPEWRLQVEIN